MHPFRRARRALTLRYCLLTVTTLVALSGVVIMGARHAALRHVDADLRARAAAVAQAIATTPNRDALWDELRELLQTGAQPVSIIIHWSPDRHTTRYWVPSSWGGHDLSESLSSPRTFTARGAPPMRVWGGQTEAGQFTLLAPLHRVNEELEDVVEALIAANALALLLTTLFGWLLAGRALRPAYDSHHRLRDFLADASHELRTPLTAIIGEADIALRRDREAAEYREALELCRDYGREMMAVVENLLELSRADAGVPVLEFEPVDVSDVARREVEAARRGIPDGPRVTCEDTAPATVAGDVDLLGRALRNLLDNALDHTPPDGEVNVRVALAPGGKEVILTVADNGPGIAQEHLPHVFDRFYRAEPPGASGRGGRVRRRGHLGLGLAITRWIAEAHGGTIAAESPPGAGATFCIRLPRHGT